MVFALIPGTYACHPLWQGTVHPLISHSRRRLESGLHHTRTSTTKCCEVAPSLTEHAGTVKTRRHGERDLIRTETQAHRHGTKQARGARASHIPAFTRNAGAIRPATRHVRQRAATVVPRPPTSAVTGAESLLRRCGRWPAPHSATSTTHRHRDAAALPPARPLASGTAAAMSSSSASADANVNG